MKKLSAACLFSHLRHKNFNFCLMNFKQMELESPPFPLKRPKITNYNVDTTIKVVGMDESDRSWRWMRRLLLCLLGFGAIVGAAVRFVSEAANCNTVQPSFSQPANTVVAGDQIEQVVSLPPADLTLPYKIPGTDLVAEKLVAYDGPYLEDDSNAEVVNVMALMLQNTGTAGVSRAQIILQAGKVEFVFEANTIPPGATVCVLEKNKAVFGQKNFTGCSGWTLTEQEGWENWPVSVEELDMGTLAIKNQTNETLESVMLYHKTWLAEIYVGGVTYVYEVPQLEPGQTLRISPEHYARGYSKVVRVTAGQ